jgi:MYXO-CTERM domain-containing protein
MEIVLSARSVSGNNPNLGGLLAGYGGEGSVWYSAQFREGSIDGPLVAMAESPEPSAQGALGLLLFGLAAVVRRDWRWQASK